MPIVPGSFENPTAEDYLNDPDHAMQHDDVNDAVETIQSVLAGLDAPSGAGQVIKSTGTGASVFTTISSNDLIDHDTAAPSVGDIRQWNGTKWVSVTVPLVTNLVWEGDTPADSSFLDPN